MDHSALEYSDPEWARLNEQAVQDPDNYEAWEALVRATEALEGGLSRNSSPHSVAAMRDVYERFLARFPLFFGYWKKFADMEFSISGTERAENVYEMGVTSCHTSVDLWTNYCGFKMDTSHDPQEVRE